jgi:regulator of sirC expression with transglutaminase-like and TPR domain
MTTRSVASLPASKVASRYVPDNSDTLRRLEEAVHRSPEQEDLLVALGDAYVRSGNKVGATAAYRRYLALDPQGEQADQVRTHLGKLSGSSRFSDRQASAASFR